MRCHIRQNYCVGGARWLSRAGNSRSTAGGAGLGGRGFQSARRSSSFSLPTVPPSLPSLPSHFPLPQQHQSANNQTQTRNLNCKYRLSWFDYTAFIWVW